MADETHINNFFVEETITDLKHENERLCKCLKSVQAELSDIKTIRKSTYDANDDDGVGDTSFITQIKDLQDENKSLRKRVNDLNEQLMQAKAEMQAVTSRVDYLQETMNKKRRSKPRANSYGALRRQRVDSF